MNLHEMESILFDMMNDSDGVSFVDIENAFALNGFDFKGNFLISTTVAEEKNIVFWGGWNKDACEAFYNALKKSNANYIRSHHLIYYMDGKIMNIPVAKRIRKYKSMHWLPVIMGVRY